MKKLILLLLSTVASYGQNSSRLDSLNVVNIKITGLSETPTPTVGTNDLTIVNAAFVQAAVNRYTIQAQRTNTNFTLALADAFTVIPVYSAGEFAITIPTNALVAFPIGTKIEITQIAGGTGSYSIVGSGVSILGNITLLDGDYTSLIKVAINTWTVTGQSKVAPTFTGAVTSAYYFANNGGQGYITSDFTALKNSSINSGLSNGTGSSPHFSFTQAYPFSSTPNLSTGQVVKNVNFSSTYTSVGG